MATVEQVQGRLRLLAARLVQRALLMPTELAEEYRALVLPVLQQEAPVGQDTSNPYSAAPQTPPGYLRDTLRGVVTGRPGQATVTFTSDAPYTRFVIDGTAAHMIYPVNSRVLAFQVGGEFVFARAVNHPGTQPNPFPQRALDATAAERAAIVHRAAGRIVSTFAY